MEKNTARLVATVAIIAAFTAAVAGAAVILGQDGPPVASPPGDPLKPSERQYSGPFQVDKREYILGEKVFLRAEGLLPDEAGQISVLRPLNETHRSVYHTVPFDGSAKASFNSYFSPGLSKALGICGPDDIVGEWRVFFQGTDYAPLGFVFTDEVLQGDEEKFEPVC